jgi:CDP-glucose 4,6-dehydratase
MNADFWRDKRVFVTGCTGLLGSWLSAELVTLGATVVGLIRDDVANSQLVRSGTDRKIHGVRGDVCDYGLIERVLAEYEIDTIFHLAAQTIVTIANRAPLSTFETNIKGTWVVLEAARRNPTVARIMVASSDKAYGDQPVLPYTEESPLQGQHPYDVSKSCADLIALSYAHTYDLPVVVTRCANLYGGGDLNWNRLIPGTIRCLLRGDQPIIRSDGTFLRDFMYIDDAVRAYLLAGERANEPGIRGQAFNFGMDDPKSVLDIVNLLVTIGDHALEPIILDQVENEIKDQYLASAKAQRLLGWEPAYSLEEGLRRTFDWYRAFLAG